MTIDRGDSIAIVVDATYGKKLRPLISGQRAWVIHSDLNRAAVEAIWVELEAPLDNMWVTIGTPEDKRPTLRAAFESITDSVLEHFPRLERNSVIRPHPLPSSPARGGGTVATRCPNGHPPPCGEAMGRGRPNTQRQELQGSRRDDDDRANGLIYTKRRDRNDE